MIKYPYTERECTNCNKYR